MIDVADIKQTLWHFLVWLSYYQHSGSININLVDILLVICLPIHYQRLLDAIFHTMPIIVDILFLVHIMYHN